MDLLQQLKKDFPQFKFLAADFDAWQPLQNTIYYSQPLCQYSLLHELGHALNGHTSYKLDIQLLKLEVDAWHKAQEIALKYNLKISTQYINQCLDTYRNWLLTRSKCLDCQIVGLQSSSDLSYNCHNCLTSWKVSLNQQCLKRHPVS